MKAEKFLFTGFLLSILFLLVVCSPREAANITRKEAISKPPVEIESTSEPWKIKWDNLVKGARKEGVLTLYSMGGWEVREALLKSMEEKFNLKVEYISGRGSDLAQRFLSERRNGIYMADIYIGGANTVLDVLKPDGVLDRLEPELFLPEAIDLKSWGGELLWIDKEKYLLAFLNFVMRPFTVNTSLVKTEEIKSYRDILNPKFKGKIIMDDPTIAGMGGNFFSVVGSSIMGYDYFRELAKQEPLITRDLRLQVEWLAQGKNLVSIATKPEIVIDFQRAGVPLAYPMPEEGMYTSSGTGNFSIVNKPAHPNAARLFVNWLLAREGQYIFAKAYGAPSGRIDVHVEGLDPTTLVKPGFKYVRGNTEEMSLNTRGDYKKAAEIFAPLIK